MPRALYDEKGAKVEVPDESELQSLRSAQEEVDKLKADLAAASDKSTDGVKALRSALERKEETIAKLQADLATKPKESLSPEDITKTATEAATKVLVDVEVHRATSNLSEEDLKLFKSKFDKLTQGEQVNLETVSVYIDEASRAAGIEKSVKVPPLRSGRGPRIEDKPKSFGDTEEGKAFAARMGLLLERPEAKK